MTEQTEVEVKPKQYKLFKVKYESGKDSLFQETLATEEEVRKEVERVLMPFGHPVTHTRTRVEMILEGYSVGIRFEEDRLIPYIQLTSGTFGKSIGVEVYLPIIQTLMPLAGRTLYSWESKSVGFFSIDSPYADDHT
jgi:hypothetical protein